MPMALSPALAPTVEDQLRNAYGPGPRALRRRWIIAVTIGETLAFTVPVIVALATLDLRPGAVLALMALAGFGEGLVLGTAQALVLKQALLGFSRVSWAVATGAGASVAWVIGMLPSTLHDTWSTWPTGLVVVLGLLLGAALLGTVGLAQWFLLRGHVARARTWVPANAAGWVLGLLALVAVVTPLWREGQDPVHTVAFGVLGGVAMAATVAAVTGSWLVRLVYPPAPTRPSPAGVPQHEWRALGTTTDTFQVFDPVLVEGLPEPVQRWLLRAIVPGTALLTAADIESTGSIRIGGTWRRLCSRQRSSLLGGFVWASRTRMAGLPVIGFDRFTHGSGEMQWRILGRIPVVSAEGDEVTRSAGGRHAAEMLAALPAVALDRSVRWTAGDHRSATAELIINGTVQAVTVFVDPVGRLERIELDRWGTPPGMPFGLYRFGAFLDQERLFDGYRVPTVVRGGWHPGTDGWEQGMFLHYRVLRCRFR